MMESGAHFCNSCGEQVGHDANGEVFVACHECYFPICKACFEYEVNEGRKICLRCATPYADRAKDDDQTTTAAQINVSQDVGLHARHVSTVSTVDSELNDESGNPIWKNRVESWKEKDKKNKKKKSAPKAENEAPIPQEQQMEEIQSSEAAAAEPLSTIIPIPKTRITPYRIVIVVRLIILGLFFHYRVTNPVDSAFGLWLTSIICEIWFAFSWVLDQFPKWYPINRDTFIDRLSARYERPGEPSQLSAVDFFVSTVDPLKEPPLITANTVLSILAVDYPVDKVSCYVSDDGAAMLLLQPEQVHSFCNRKMAYPSSQNSQPALPLHLCLFLLTLCMLLGFSWYSSYEPIMESFMDEVKLVLMVSPLLLLLVVHFLCNYGGGGGVLSSLVPLPERESLHRAGGTPWGVGFVLVLLLFMVSYQSSFQERWFPLLSR